MAVAAILDVIYNTPDKFGILFLIGAGATGLGAFLFLQFRNN